MACWRVYLTQHKYTCPALRHVFLEDKFQTQLRTFVGNKLQKSQSVFWRHILVVKCLVVPKSASPCSFYDCIMIQFPRPYRMYAPSFCTHVKWKHGQWPPSFIHRRSTKSPGNQVASLYTMSCVFVRMHQPKGLKNTKKMGDDSITERCEYDKWAKNPYVTFHYTAWFIGILMLASYNPSIPR